MNQVSGTTADLKAVSAPGGSVAWVVGDEGTVLRTLDGHTWEPRPVPGAEALKFRCVHALNARRAWVLASGPGDKGRIYHTTDGGATWTCDFRNPEPEGFLDGFAFWDSTHGLAFGDPVRGRFQVLRTSNQGRSWQPIQGTVLPAAFPEEGAFSASGTCLTVQGRSQAWFVTGSAARSRVFRTENRGRTWAVSESPVPAGSPSTGLFSVAFLDFSTGVAVGGDHEQKVQASPHVVRSSDGGRTWRAVSIPDEGFLSAVVGVPGVKGVLVALGLSGTRVSRDQGRTWEACDKIPLNAVAFVDPQTGWAVGPKGLLVRYGGPAFQP